MRDANFKIGDRVKVTDSGMGCAGESIGVFVRITAIGSYDGDIGYRVEPAIGNSKTYEDDIEDGYDGFIGQDSFELYNPTSWKEKIGGI